MATKRIGNQKPTKSVILPYTKSSYEKAIELYEKSGRTAQEWQVNMMKHIMATNDENLWTHTKIGYSLPRRNGKNELILIRELYALFAGEQVLHTAHRTTASHSGWEKLITVLDKIGVEYNSLKAIGRERVEVPETGGRVEFRTRTSTGGLGEGFDLLVIDEAQEYTDDQESALKYVVTDSVNPQTIMCGTPTTAVAAGTVFPAYRTNVLEGGGDVPDSLWAEWGVDEMTDCHDVDAWYLTNPSLGTILSERAVRNEIGSDKEDFNIQRLGLWVSYNQSSAISAEEWEALAVEDVPELTGQLYVGVKYGIDGNNVALSIAAKTKNGDIFIESYDCRSVRNGNYWIIDFLKQADVKTVVVDGASGQSLLSDEMKEAGLKAPILPTVKEIIAANSVFEQGIYQGSIKHCDQPSLTQVVTNCLKRNIGSSGGFGYKAQFDDMDIALMDSAILAYWACSKSKPAKVQQIWY